MNSPIMITIHSKTGCPFCEAAVRFLDDIGATKTTMVTEIKHDNENGRRAMYADITMEFGISVKSVPVIILTDLSDGERMLIPGFKALQIQGLHSLFQDAPSDTAPVAVSTEVSFELAGDIVVAEEGSSCCE